MTSKNKPWKDNTRKYLFALYLVEREYKGGKLNKKEKKKIEERLSFLFKKNYWKLNPNLKNPVISKILNSRFNTFYI